LAESIIEVEEADVDRAWQFYLASAPAFRERVLSAVSAERFAEVHGGRFLGARRSVTSATGETDVMAEWVDTGGQRLVLLIEDKLTAGFQRDQGMRYAARAEALAAEAEVRTILAAPRGYLAAANPESWHFGCKLALEDVLQWMADSGVDVDVALEKAREGLRRAVTGVALGAKGLFPSVHALLAEELTHRGSDLRITNNATDWIFLIHPSCPVGVEIRYRIRHNIPELAFTPAFQGKLAGVLAACASPLKHSESGSYRFVRSATGPVVSEGASAGRPGAADATAIADSLERLVRWWIEVGAPAGDVAPGV
jgi:hypothetical protein